jgi:hypothetical protein
MELPSVEIPEELLQNSTSIEEIRAYLNENWRKGIPCPCCARLVKLYRRSMSANMGRLLIVFWQHNKKNEFVKATKTIFKEKFGGNGDFAQLRHWGLLEPGSGLRDDGSSRNGVWRLTPLGIDFVNELRGVPRYVYLYNQEFLGIGGEEVYISDVLENHFDYRELMNG